MLLVSLSSVFSKVWKTWQSHFRCSDVTQSFWLKSSLNMRFGLLWCEVSSDAILACYLPLLFSVTHSCKDWHGSCQRWVSAFYSWWLQIKDMGKVNSGSAMTSWNFYQNILLLPDKQHTQTWNLHLFICCGKEKKKSFLMTRRKTTTIRRVFQIQPLPALHIPCLKKTTPLKSEIVKLLFCGVGKRFIEIW